MPPDESGRVTKMSRYTISTGTITHAIKGRDLLRRGGYSAQIERRTTGLSGAGCGYNIILNGDIATAERLLKGAGIKINSIKES